VLDRDLNSETVDYPTSTATRATVIQNPAVGCLRSEVMASTSDRQGASLLSTWRRRIPSFEIVENVINVPSSFPMDSGKTSLDPTLRPLEESRRENKRPGNNEKNVKGVEQHDPDNPESHERHPALLRERP
jgi:hypothetical protein